MDKEGLYDEIFCARQNERLSEKEKFIKFE